MTPYPRPLKTAEMKDVVVTRHGGQDYDHQKNKTRRSESTVRITGLLARHPLNHQFRLKLANGIVRIGGVLFISNWLHLGAPSLSSNRNTNKLYLSEFPDPRSQVLLGHTIILEAVRRSDG